MLAILLMVAVAAGIAWPFVSARLAANRAAASTEPVFEGAGVAPGVTPRPRGSAYSDKEELCPSCARLNPPGRSLCIDCGAQMPVNDIRRVFENADRDDLIREGVQSGALLIGMVIAMALANFLPTGGKILILVATIAFLGWRTLKAIQN